MPGLFDESGLLFAQDAGNASSWNGLSVSCLPIPFLFYFMIWLPSSSKRRSAGR